MSLFNDSGLITQGFGRDQRLLTQGYTISFEVGGPTPVKKEFTYFLLVPILKEMFEDMGIYAPVEKRKFMDLQLNSNIFKEIKRNLGILANVDPRKLMTILDAI